MKEKIMNLLIILLTISGIVLLIGMLCGLFFLAWESISHELQMAEAKTEMYRSAAQGKMIGTTIVFSSDGEIKLIQGEVNPEVEE